MFLATQIEMILREMYDWVKPQCAVPVHGEHRHMIEHMKFRTRNESTTPCSSRKW